MTARQQAGQLSPRRPGHRHGGGKALAELHRLPDGRAGQRPERQRQRDRVGGAAGPPAGPHHGRAQLRQGQRAADLRPSRKTPAKKVLSKIKVTNASFWRPSGKNLNKSSTQGRPEDEWGVIPDKVIPLEPAERFELSRSTCAMRRSFGSKWMSRWPRRTERTPTRTSSSTRPWSTSAARSRSTKKAGVARRRRVNASPPRIGTTLTSLTGPRDRPRGPFFVPAARFAASSFLGHDYRARASCGADPIRHFPASSVTCACPQSPSTLQG